MCESVAKNTLILKYMFGSLKIPSLIVFRFFHLTLLMEVIVSSHIHDEYDLLKSSQYTGHSIKYLIKQINLYQFNIIIRECTQDCAKLL